MRANSLTSGDPESDTARGAVGSHVAALAQRPYAERGRHAAGSGLWLGTMAAMPGCPILRLVGPRR
jgi:hypothetical protein